MVLRDIGGNQSEIWTEKDERFRTVPVPPRSEHDGRS